jgi:hypothetical protein
MLKLRAAISAAAVVLALALSGCSGVGKNTVQDETGQQTSGAPVPAAASPLPGEGPPTVPPGGFTEPPGSLYASPSGRDTSCSRDTPCALPEALSQVESGNTVALLDGDFGKLTISAVRALERLDGQATVMPAQGASPVVSSLDLRSPNTVWHGVHFTGTVMITGFAPNTELSAVHVEGAGVYVRAKSVTVRNSLLEDGVSTDGIQVGQAEGVLIEGNRIRNYAQENAAGFHSDCIQMFDSEDITIRGNVLSNCYNSSLIFSPGKGDGTHNVLIESNFVQGCTQINAACRGGVTLDMRTTDTNTRVVVRNNTFVDGAVRAGTLPESLFDRNYVEYLSYCETPMTNSIVSAWNKGLCASPDNLDKGGNRQGSPVFTDQASADLRVDDASMVKISPVPGPRPAPRDLFGDPLSPNTAGGYAPR